MGVIFVLLFPFGAALIRLLNTRIPNAFALHRGLQILNLILAFVGLGMGVWRSNITGTVRKFLRCFTPCYFPKAIQMFSNLILHILKRSTFLNFPHPATPSKKKKRKKQGLTASYHVLISTGNTPIKSWVLPSYV